AAFLIHACYLFFFSSRRRHTSLVSDWSSDVCSSDLPSSLLRSVKPSAGGGKMDAISAFADHVVATRFDDIPADALRAAKVFILEDRKSVVLGKSVDLSGRGVIRQKDGG